MNPLLLAAGAVAGGFGIARLLKGGTMTKGEQVVAKIRTVLGVPYIWGGKHPTRGFDCSGVVGWALEELGFAPKGFASSHNTDSLFKIASPVTGKPIPGDLAFYGPGGDPNHVMVYIGRGYVIGASGGGRDTNTVEKAKAQDARVKILRANYRNDFIRYGRLREVET